MPIHAWKELVRVKTFHMLRMDKGFAYLNISGNFNILAKFNAIKLLATFLDQNVMCHQGKWEEKGWYCEF